MLQLIAGEVIFDRSHPTLPPDIIFSPQDELLEFDPNVDRLKVILYVKSTLAIFS